MTSATVKCCVGKTCKVRDCDWRQPHAVERRNEEELQALLDAVGVCYRPRRWELRQQSQYVRA